MILLALLISTAEASLPKLSIIIPPEEIKKIIQEKAEKYDLDPIFFESMIRCESAFNVDAVNKEGKKDLKAWSRGLGQVQYYTAWGMDFRGTLKELHNPENNLEYAARYLREKLDQYGGDYAKAISAYNAGRFITGNRPHVDRILEYADRLSRVYLQAAI